MRKAFTVLELVFVIVILGILAAIGTSKLFSVMETKAISKFNDEYMMVTSSISSEFAKTISKGRFEFPKTLEKLAKDGSKEDVGFVFDAIIPKHRILASDIKDIKKGSWVYNSANNYSFYINANKIIKLNYDANSGKLKCKEFVCSDCDADERKTIINGLKASCPL